MTVASIYDQRWQDRQEHRRTPGERIKPSEYGVCAMLDRGARQFIEQHHYSGSYPASHLAVGLFRKGGGGGPAFRLVGAAVFSEGVMSHKAMPKWTGFDRSVGTELGRLVLLPEVPHNGESWFIRRAFDVLRAEKPHMRVVLSYSDPVERMTDAGQIVKPGHFGTIYQASNALYLGRATGRTLLLRPDGRVLHPYAINKAQHRRRGWQHAYRAIQEAGGPRERGESEADWIARVAASLRRLRHPGNLTYAFGLDSESWAQLRALNFKDGKPLPYPKASEWRMAA